MSRDLLKLISEKFTSGNSIEVERITITRAEYEQELAKPEPTPRQLQRLRQAAWKNIKQDVYNDDPEIVFAMGFDAGYGAVARKVEPSQDECGGFDSRPAPLAQPEQEPKLTELELEIKEE